MPVLSKTNCQSLQSHLQFPMVTEKKAFDRSNLSGLQRTTDNYSNQEKPKGSLQRTILSPRLPASCFCDLGQAPASWSSLCYTAPSCLNTRKEQHRTEDARRERWALNHLMRFLDPPIKCSTLIAGRVSAAMPEE